MVNSTDHTIEQRSGQLQTKLILFNHYPKMYPNTQLNLASLSNQWKFSMFKTQILEY